MAEHFINTLRQISRIYTDEDSRVRLKSSHSDINSETNDPEPPHFWFHIRVDP